MYQRQIPERYESRCKVCCSPFRPLIEEMRVEGGLSLRKIRSILQEAGVKRMSLMSLSRHFRKHLKKIKFQEF